MIQIWSWRDLSPLGHFPHMFWKRIAWGLAFLYHNSNVIVPSPDMFGSLWLIPGFKAPWLFLFQVKLSSYKGINSNCHSLCLKQLLYLHSHVQFSSYYFLTLRGALCTHPVGTLFFHAASCSFNLRYLLVYNFVFPTLFFRVEDRASTLVYSCTPLILHLLSYLHYSSDQWALRAYYLPGGSFQDI